MVVLWFCSGFIVVSYWFYSGFIFFQWFVMGFRFYGGFMIVCLRFNRVPSGLIGFIVVLSGF